VAFVRGGGCVGLGERKLPELVPCDAPDERSDTTILKSIAVGFGVEPGKAILRFVQIPRDAHRFFLSGIFRLPPAPPFFEHPFASSLPPCLCKSIPRHHYFVEILRPLRFTFCECHFRPQRVTLGLG